MRRVLFCTTCAAALLALHACSPGQLVKGAAGSIAGAALGTGPRANVQAGKTNSQALVTRISNQRLEGNSARTIEQSAGQTGVRAEAVQSVTVRNEAPPWVWLLLLAGWVLPSPGQIGRAGRQWISRLWRGGRC